jgi:hypothetical protein
MLNLDYTKQWYDSKSPYDLKKEIKTIQILPEMGTIRRLRLNLPSSSEKLSQGL